MLDVEFGVALAMGHISPHDVVQAVAGWHTEQNYGKVRSGFVVQLVSGEFAYITTFRDPRRRYVESSTQRFGEEPFYLYERGEKWQFDKEELNGSTEIAKQKANYPTGGIAHRAEPGKVVRIPI